MQTIVSKLTIAYHAKLRNVSTECKVTVQSSKLFLFKNTRFWLSM